MGPRVQDLANIWCGGWGMHGCGLSKVWELVWVLNEVGQLGVGYGVAFGLALGLIWFSSWTWCGTGVGPGDLRTSLRAWCGDQGQARLWVQQGVGAWACLDGVASWVRDMGEDLVCSLASPCSGFGPGGGTGVRTGVCDVA